MIEFKDVSKSFKDKKVLDNISFNIEDGEFVCIIGGSGCGKTTALKMINRLINPSSGTIYVNGKDISKENEIELRRNIGYVIQQTGIFPHMTVRENIELIPKLKNKGKKRNGNEKKEDSKKLLENVKNVLMMVGLNPDEFMDKYPIQMSGGQQQRVGVARAFASNPDIILMDEPFSALDPITRNQLQDELVTLQDKMKKTIVFVTHDMGEAIKLADRICILNNGKIEQFDTPEKILKNPANDFVLNFVGKKRIWDSPDLIKAEDIMIENPIVCISRLKAIKAQTIMRESRVDSVIVIDENRKFLGKVDASDVASEFSKDKRVMDIMDKNCICVSPRDSIISVLNKAKENNMYTIPVVDNEKLVGLITKSTLVTALSRKYDESEVE
ncbi:ABC transporter ATP-binding protein [Peptacetobacter sp.]|uniref:ABC transporter ATP-binding protein n=1 Tax=Peptacetobacter sp. TaxID=2991975 RepID=UPI002627913F|nr:ABC transporter ATP-binding protein [Peptacetobacter sp.]